MGFLDYDSVPFLTVVSETGFFKLICFVIGGLFPPIHTKNMTKTEINVRGWFF